MQPLVSHDVGGVCAWWFVLALFSAPFGLSV